MYAYCYASGLIEFGRKVPNGAIWIAQGPAKSVRDFIEPVARHGYRTKPVDGRPTKIPGSDHLLVPGVPEATDEFRKERALRAFCDWIGKKPPKGVLVS